MEGTAWIPDPPASSTGWRFMEWIYIDLSGTRFNLGWEAAIERADQRLGGHSLSLQDLWWGLSALKPNLICILQGLRSYFKVSNKRRPSWLLLVFILAWESGVLALVQVGSLSIVVHEWHLHEASWHLRRLLLTHLVRLVALHGVRIGRWLHQAWHASHFHLVHSLGCHHWESHHTSLKIGARVLIGLHWIIIIGVGGARRFWANLSILGSLVHHLNSELLREHVLVLLEHLLLNCHLLVHHLVLVHHLLLLLRIELRWIAILIGGSGWGVHWVHLGHSHSHHWWHHSWSTHHSTH